MQIRARVLNREEHHLAEVETEGQRKAVKVPGKSEGRGLDLNGGELLFLSLATCYCNDVFREARTTGLTIDDIEVTVEGTFAGRGDPAQEIAYSVRVTSPDDPGEVESLLRATDEVAEIQNTLRLGIPVTLTSVVAEPPSA